MAASDALQLRLALTSSVVTAVGVIYIALQAREAKRALERMESRQMEADEITMEQLEATVDRGDA